ncbi:MAG: T9SS type A sorting domain-containing protein [Candidatus Zixiibacteriota bacterium]
MKRFIFLIFMAALLFSFTDWKYWRDINYIEQMEYFQDNIYLGSQNGFGRTNPYDFDDFEVFTAIDGFAGTRISNLSANDEHIWYSTYEGYLGRYDGYNFEIFFDLVRDDYRINDFLLLEERLLVATNKGLLEIEILDNFLVARIEKVIDQIANFPRESDVYCLFFRNDSLWAGMTSGAARINIDDDMRVSSNWSSYESSRAVKAFGFYHNKYYLGLEYQDSVSSLAILEDGIIDTIKTSSRTTRPINQIFVQNDTFWIAGVDGIYGNAPAYMTEPDAQLYWLMSTEGVNYTYSILPLDGKLYFGLRTKGIGWINPETGRMDSYRFPTPTGGTFNAMATSDDQIWALSASNGANYYNRNDWEIFNYKLYEHTDPDIDSRMSSFLYTLTCAEFDHRGNLWMGSRGYAIGIYKGDSVWSFLDSENSMIVGKEDSPDWEYVLDIAADSAGNMWIVQDNPYHRYPVIVFNGEDLEGEELWKIRSDWSPLPDIDNPTCIDVRSNRAWIGTHEGRILGIDWHYDLFDTLRYTWYYYVSEEVTGYSVNDIEIDSRQHVWAATNLGLVRIEPEIDEVIPIDFPSNLSTEVRAVELDDWDNIWVATDDGAAVISGFSGDMTIFKSMYDPDASDEERSGLFSNNIYDIGIDPRTQDVWFLSEGGISILSREIKQTEEVDEIKVYPNPVNFGIGQEMIFSELPANPYLTIYTTNGDPVINYDPSYTDFANRFIWDGANAAGNEVASGIYIYTINANDKVIKGTILVK